MPHTQVDYYEVLQISPNAEPETIQRVYRLLAQRYHPDNQETGNAARFRTIHEAYTILSNPETRVRYDVSHRQHQKDRWKLASRGPASLDERGAEKAVRLTVLEILCAQRRIDPNNPGLFPAEIEQLTGVPKEHLEFSTWYLIQKRLVQRSDSSRLVITAEGVDYLDEQPSGLRPVPRLVEAVVEKAS